MHKKTTQAEEFAARLREARQSRYASQREFAAALGVQTETYGMWERGDREPSIKNLAIIAETLDVSLDYLILGLMPRLTAAAPAENEPAQTYPAWIWRTDAEHRMAAPNNKSGVPPFLNHGECRWEYGLNPSIPWAEVEAIMDRHEPLDRLVFQYFYNGQLDTIVVSGEARYNEQGEFLGYSGPGDHLDEKAFAAYREAILVRASAAR